MTAYCLTTSPGNVEKTAALGWKLQGIKSRRGKLAQQLRPGDKLVYYVTGASAFAAVVEITSEAFEDHELIWTSKATSASGAGRAGEDYPWRVEIAPEVALDERDQWVPAEELREQLEFPRKWPAEHWKLAFQGNIREWPDHDYQVVKAALEEAGRQSR